jgi:hypothetical protein
MKPTLPLREPGSKNDSENQTQNQPGATSPASHLTPFESQEAAPATARPQLLRSPLARVSSVAQDEDDDAAPNHPRPGAAPAHARASASAVAPPPARPTPPTLSYDPRDPSLTRAEATTSGEGTAKGTSPVPSQMKTLLLN